MTLPDRALCVKSIYAALSVIQTTFESTPNFWKRYCKKMKRTKPAISTFLVMYSTLNQFHYILPGFTVLSSNISNEDNHDPLTITTNSKQTTLKCLDKYMENLPKKKLLLLNWVENIVAYGEIAQKTMCLVLSPVMSGFWLWDFSTQTAWVLVNSPGSRHWAWYI